ncbi:MAG: cell division protein ZapA [Oscillospiraceae bacterium]
METTKKVKINICDTDYTIVTTEDTATVHALAEQLDEDMKALMEKNSRISVTTAAILCALSTMDELQKESRLASLQGQIKEYCEQTDKAGLRLWRRGEISKMKREIELLRNAVGRDVC